MATLDTLVRVRNELFEVTIPLGRRDYPERHFYGFPEFMDWMQNDVPQLERGRLNADDSPNEQLDQLLYIWITGKRVAYDRMFKDLMPAGDEVWEMKTADLRIFG